MRFSTSFDRDRLPRHRDGKGRDPAGYRRLVRLVIALALVLALMKQAGNPAAYRVFFPDQANGLVPDKDEAQKNPEPTTNSVDRIDSEVGGLNMQAGDGPPVRLAESEINENEKQDLQRVRDGAIWTAEDAPAFYRLLAGDSTLLQGRATARLVGVIPLLQQPEVYLKQCVAVRGKVGRITRQAARDNQHGVTEYFELWLEPEDGSRRPVAFYTRQPPSLLRDLVGPEYLATGPLLEVSGVYLKRLAFRSSAGSELAPAIVGSVRWLESTSPVPSPARTNAAGPQPWQLIMAAVLIGMVTVYGVYRLSTAATRRMRAERQTNQPFDVQQLTSLSDPSDEKKQS